MISSEYFARGCAQAHPMGVASEPPGGSNRVARGVVSDPSWVRLKDLVFCQLGIFKGIVVFHSREFHSVSARLGLYCGSRPWWSAGLSLVGMALWLWNPRWADLRLFMGPDEFSEEIFLVHVPPVGKESGCFGKANRPTRFWWERIGIMGACPTM